MKETPVLGGFDRSNYVTERRWAAAPDSTKVPLTLLWRKGVAKLDGSDPLLLDGCVCLFLAAVGERAYGVSGKDMGLLSQCMRQKSCSSRVG